jgi:hypothetical protein
MSFIFARQQTPEEIKEIRQQRQKYQDYLSTTKTNVEADVNKQAITPESGQAILKKIQGSETWLEKHPNANFNELVTSQDATNVEISRILKTDKPKRVMNNTILALPVIAAEGIQKKTLTNEQAEKLKEIAANTAKWYKKHSATATEIEFSQEQLKLKDSIQTGLVQPDAVMFVQYNLDAASTLQTSDLEANIAKQEANLSEVKSQTVDYKEGANAAISTTAKVFLIFILVIFFLMCGSFAANYAIGRPPAYRVLYFCYGAFPLFAPFILLYSIYRRIRYGKRPLYAMLPISTEPSFTPLGRWFWNPLFYWIPDHNSIQAMKEYTESLAQVVG